MKILPAAVVAQAALRVASDRDCCVWARAVLERAYGPEVIRRVPLARWHLWADTAGVGPWEPVLAAIDAGIGTPAEKPTAGRWHIAQGWRGSVDPWPPPPTTSGHTWLYYAITDEMGLLLDSTRSRGPRVDGLARWADHTAQFRGGVVLAVLEKPSRG